MSKDIPEEAEEEADGVGRLYSFARAGQAFLAAGSRLTGKKKTAILAAAVLLLFGGIALSLHAQPDILSRLNGVPALLLLLVGVPVTILINSLEFQATARLLNRSVGFRAALEITTIGSAANLLPVPGGALSRIAGLTLAGSSLREAAILIFFMSLAWIGVAFIAGAMPLFQIGDILPGLLLLTFGTALTAVSVAASLKISANVKRTFVAFALKVLLVAWDGIRMYWALLAVDAGVDLATAFIFVLASVAGSTITIIPAGFGIREGTAALLALAVGVPAALGFLAASLTRLAELAILLPVGLWLAYRRRSTNGATEPDDAAGRGPT